MRTPDDGLVAVSYAPCKLTTFVGGVAVRATVETDYPFREAVRIVVVCQSVTRFPLLLRIPAWANGALLTVDGISIMPLPGTLSSY